MEIGQVGHFDSLAAGSTFRGIHGLGLREQASRIQWIYSRVRAEGRGQAVADVLAVPATDIRESEDLGPDGAEGRGFEVLLANGG